jgi:hypothetical protein
MNPRVGAAGLTCLFLTLAVARGSAQGGASFRIDETTNAEVHAAFRAGDHTCRALV